MSRTETTSVLYAFENLLEEIETEINLVNQQGERAFQRSDYDLAREVIEKAVQIQSFRERLVGLRREWERIAPTENETAIDEAQEEIQRQNLGRLEAGVRTPENVFFPHILRALVELGGSANLNAVLDRVGEATHHLLRPVDHEPIRSDPTRARWRNTCQWARYTLVTDGLMKSDSPRGTWEISDAGRRWIEENGG